MNGINEELCGLATGFKLSHFSKCVNLNFNYKIHLQKKSVIVLSIFANLDQIGMDFF